MATILRGTICKQWVFDIFPNDITKNINNDVCINNVLSLTVPKSRRNHNFTCFELVSFPNSLGMTGITKRLNTFCPCSSTTPVNRTRGLGSMDLRRSDGDDISSVTCFCLPGGGEESDDRDFLAGAASCSYQVNELSPTSWRISHCHPAVFKYSGSYLVIIFVIVSSIWVSGQFSFFDSDRLSSKISWRYFSNLEWHIQIKNIRDHEYILGDNFMNLSAQSS